VGFIVDAEDYFRLFVEAASRAKRSIFILAWDFDSRTSVTADENGRPILLGEFLNGLCKRNRQLRIRILDWDYPMVYGTDRDTPPTALGLASWEPHRRIDFRFDDTHPLAGSHHQKIVLIDDRVAFSGGLDLTNKRWDTRKHGADDPRRTFNGDPYPPFHDVMVAVDGEAAAKLAEVARARWRAATGEKLAFAPAKSDPWPPGLEPALREARVAISRTAPPVHGDAGCREVEALYLDMVKRAKRYIYIENQYLTSETVGAALRESLAAADGPEIVVVTRLLSHGWLEEITMTALRTKLVRELRAADSHGRFRCYYPDVAGLCEGTCLDIHSKVMVVDDEWARIGSANLCNRSMGMDTECDVTVEAGGDPAAMRAIRAFRDGLIAEHSGCELAEAATALEREGSMSAAIAHLGKPGRELKELPAPELDAAALAVASIGDPGAPLAIERIVEVVAPPAAQAKVSTRRWWVALAGLVAVALALALAWVATPLGDWITRENAMAIASSFAGQWWAPFAILLVYTPASFIMFPRWILTMTAVLTFGPWKGLVLALAGIAIAGCVTFIPGRMVSRDTVRRVTGPRLRPVTRFLENRGLFAVVLVRLVPIAPFPVVNLVMGAMRVKLWQFVLGTVLGMLPGTLATTVLSDQLATALGAGSVNYWFVGGALAMLGALAWFGQHTVRRHSH
jgi:phosphatidylserine/phosphatidylglycerophosphate/cardiolipin synthase-like enzyme/uncharacterized membrane protein YdjX (TVP38/TMEM64 family)